MVTDARETHVTDDFVASEISTSDGLIHICALQIFHYCTQIVGAGTNYGLHIIDAIHEESAAKRNAKT
jgi:hypothetical protein